MHGMNKVKRNLKIRFKEQVQETTNNKTNCDFAQDVLKNNNNFRNIKDILDTYFVIKERKHMDKIQTFHVSVKRPTVKILPTPLVQIPFFIRKLI
jgi:hypothetical protein